jgi:hypothetical protein
MEQVSAAPAGVTVLVQTNRVPALAGTRPTWENETTMGTTLRQWVNDSRTVLVTLWITNDGSETMTVAFREDPGHTWGPPVNVHPDATT